MLDTLIVVLLIVVVIYGTSLILTVFVGLMIAFLPETRLKPFAFCMDRLHSPNVNSVLKPAGVTKFLNKLE